MSETKTDFGSAAEAVFAENPDIQALLRLEPGSFLGDEGQTGKESSPPSQDVAPEKLEQQPGKVESPSAGSSPGAEPSRDTDLERMKGFFRGLELAAAAQQQQGRGPQQDSPPAPPPPPPYSYEVNEQLLRAITSEDMMERRNAILAFATNLSQTVHQRAVNDVLNQIASVIPQYVQQVALQEYARREVARDFYGTYPELNRPEIAPVVAQVAQQVVAEAGFEGWTPRVRDEIASRTKALLAAIAGTSRPQQKPAPQMTDQAASPMQSQQTRGINVLRELGLE